MSESRFRDPPLGRGHRQGIPWLHGTHGPGSKAAFSPDGSRVVSCSNDRTSSPVGRETGVESRPFPGHENAVRCVAFAPDGRRVLSGGRTTRQYGVGRGHRQRSRGFEGHTDLVNGVASTRWAASGLQRVGQERRGSRDVENGGHIRSFSGCKTGENLVTFSPDGRFILSGSGWRPGWQGAGFDYGVRLREVVTGRSRGCFESHTAPVLTVAFSPDGRTALSAGHEERDPPAQAAGARRGSASRTGGMNGAAAPAPSSRDSASHSVSARHRARLGGDPPDSYLDSRARLPLPATELVSVETCLTATRAGARLRSPATELASVACCLTATSIAARSARPPPSSPRWLPPDSYPRCPRTAPLRPPPSSPRWLAA